MSNFGLLARAFPGILLSIAILLAVLAIAVKVTSGRWPTIAMLGRKKRFRKEQPDKKERKSKPVSS